MLQSSESEVTGSRYQFGDVSPSAAAESELRWFFNEAESEVDQPSNFEGLVAGASRTSLEEVERRAEALHSAGKIRDRLRAVPLSCARTLEALFRERAWPPRVEEALGVLAGPVAAMPVVLAEHLRALAACRTSARTVAAWMEERVAADPAALAPWRPEAEMWCRIAVTAYERARGRGPSVVPQEEG